MRTDAGIKWGFLWDGTLYRPPENAEQFIALPWEIEAYGGTQGVLELYGIQQRSRENIEVEKIF
jgi:hypothetical protein